MQARFNGNKSTNSADSVLRSDNDDPITRSQVSYTGTGRTAYQIEVPENVAGKATEEHTLEGNFHLNYPFVRFLTTVNLIPKT